jgi:caa(3)-type oxidase subunit IV
MSSDPHGHEHSHGHEHGHGHEHSHGHEHGHGPSFNLYLVIFIALSVFTIVSFIVNGMVRAEPPVLTHTQGFLIILGVACVKATLVGMYFMHLKYDWGRLFFVIIPVSIMAVLLIVVLMPDIVLAWHIER